MNVDRFVIVVLDGVGIGEAPDADLYGDTGSNTLANTARAVGGLRLPHLTRLGLGNIAPIAGVPPQSFPQSSWGRMEERSAGKDTTTGHWEIAGCVLDKPFPTYPQGFPADVIQAFEARIGRSILGNRPASGTQIIEALGAKHLATGSPIVYTSADSVFQIAAHVDVIAEDELYQMCQTARALLQGEHAVGRVIARPFRGQPGAFERTAGRRDFSLPPPDGTLLDRVHAAGLGVFAVGKIADIFAGRGITHHTPTKSNAEGVAATIDLLCRVDGPGLIFTNLVEFDMVYGHRNDPVGFARALAEVDAAVPSLLQALRPRDVLVFTADHGVDPTTPSTDHSREYVPLLCFGTAAGPVRPLGTRRTFADVAATALDLFGCETGPHGTSLMKG